VKSGSAGQAGIDSDAEAAWRGWIVAPLGDQIEASAGAKRLPAGSGKGNPIPGRMPLQAGREAAQQRIRVRLVFEEGAQEAAAIGQVHFHDACRAQLRQLGD
jgi:hypothetical protein